MVFNKKGSVIDLIVFIVLAFVIVAFLGMWAYGFSEVTDLMQTVDVAGSPINISSAAEDTFGLVDSAYDTWLPIIAFFMIFSTAIAILISNFLVKVHPAFLLIYLFVIIVCVIASVYLSNAYEEHLLNGIASSTFQEWDAASYMLINLPFIVTVFGVFGMVLLFAGIIREKNQGGGIV